MRRWSLFKWVQRKFFHRLAWNLTACLVSQNVHALNWPWIAPSLMRNFRGLEVLSLCTTAAS